MKTEEIDIPETLEEKRLYSLELLEKLEQTEGVHNRLSLCWVLVRRDHFNGDGKRFSEWVYSLDPDLCRSLLSQRLAVGTMLEDFRRRNGAVFSVLMALPFWKNVVLAYIPTPALRDEFLSKYDLPSLKKISRERSKRRRPRKRRRRWTGSPEKSTGNGAERSFWRRPVRRSGF